MVLGILLGAGVLVCVLLIGIGVVLSRGEGSSDGDNADQAKPQPRDRYAKGTLAEGCGLIPERLLTRALGPKRSWSKQDKNRHSAPSSKTTTVTCTWISTQNRGFDQDLSKALQITMKVVLAHPDVFDEPRTGASYLKESFAVDIRHFREDYGAHRVSGIGDAAYVYYETAEPPHYRSAVIGVRDSNLTLTVDYTATISDISDSGTAVATPVPRTKAEQTAAYLAPRILADLSA